MSAQRPNLTVAILRILFAVILFAVILFAVILLSACSRTPTITPDSPVPSPAAATPTRTQPPPAAPTQQPVTQASAALLPMFRGGPAHSGVYAVEGDFGEWHFNAGGPVGVSPVLAGDTLYFGTMNGALYALDPGTQQVRWQHPIPRGIFSSPAVAAGTLYAGGMDGVLYALDASSGHEKWKFQAQGEIVPSPAVAGELVYFADAQGWVYALDAGSGTEKWKFQTGGRIQSSPAVADGLVVIGSYDSFLYALDAASGQKKWMYLTEGPIASSPAVVDGAVYVGNQSSNTSFYAIDLQSGKPRWKLSGMPVFSSPAVVDGVIYCGGMDGSLYAVSTQDGSLVWKARTPALILSSPAVTAGLVVVGGTDGQVYAFDRQTGARQWSFQTNGEIWSSPAVAGSTVFIGSGDGYLYALGSRSPQLALAPTPTVLPLQPTPTRLPDPKILPEKGSGGLPWWNDRVFYEIFVRSFSDSNGDGTGDLQGLIDRLDYLNDGNPDTQDDLGVTGLWLMPVNEAPSIHGYDATNYLQIEQDYGNNTDFLRLVDEAHKRGMVVVVDMVMNHLSSSHPWFIDASQPGSVHENWFIWSPAKPDYTSPWGSEVWHKLEFGLGGMRSYHGLFDYYYGLFSPDQPDLNYGNGAVTEEMFDILRYWLKEMKVDGLRLDAVRHLVEDEAVQENTPETHYWLENFHRFVHIVDPNVLTIGEIWDDTADVVPYVGDEVDIAFEFRLAEAIIQSLNEGDNAALANQLHTVLSSYPAGQFATFLTNHDMARVMTQLDKDPAKARLAAAMLLTFPGVPFIYYGEEIGMEGPLPDINVRRPMQWDSGPNAGFTTGTIWLPPGTNVTTANVAAEAADPGSLLSTYRTLIHLRQEHSALLGGDTWILKSSVPQVFGLLRRDLLEAVLFVANLSDQPVSGYQLSLGSGNLRGKPKASLLLGEGSPLSPTINAAGGFQGYTPLPELPPYSVLLIQLKP